MNKRAGRAAASSDQALRESQERPRLALRGQDIIIALSDTDLRYMWMHCAPPDFDPRCVRGRRDTELADNAGTRRLERLKRTVIESGAPSRRAITFPHADGPRTYEVQADPVRDPSGRVMAVTTVAVEITARTRAEAALARLNATLERNVAERTQALHDRDARLRTLSRAIEQNPASIIITNTSGEIEFVNPKFSEVTGYTLEEVRGKNPRVLKSGSQPAEFYREMWETIKAGRDWRGEFCNRRKNGEEFWEFAVIAPILDERGAVTHFVAIKEDITERRRAADALREREERLRAILNTVMDAIITLDRTGTIVGLNPAAGRMFGYGEAEMLGQNVSMLMPSPFGEKHGQYLDDYLRAGRARITGTGREIQARRKDGTVFPIDLAVGEIDHLHMFTGVIRDITERKRMEAELLRISEREQHRIGMDLHDGLGPQIAAIAILNDALLGSLQARELPEAAAAARLKELLKGASEKMREIARGLLPVSADPDGLMAGLETYLRNLSGGDSGGARIAFECPETVRVHDESIATHLFRIAQEAVRNAILHAAARNITVRLTSGKGRINIEVADDGIGTNVGDFKGNGLGLRTMRYRASAMGGSLEIHHPPWGGTVVLCSISNPSSTAQLREDASRPAASSDQVEHCPDR